MKNLFISVCILCAIAISCDQTQTPIALDSKQSKDEKQDQTTKLKDQESQLQYPHYDISLELIPQKAHIKVKGEMTFPNSFTMSKDNYFLLDRGMNAKNIQSNDGINFIRSGESSGNRFLPVATKYYPKSNIESAQTLSFNYEGTLSDLPPYFANISNVKWAEIGLYHPWFPYFNDFKTYTYSIKIKAPEDYNVFGLGKSIQNGDSFTLTSTTPTNDIVVCASKDHEAEKWKSGKMDITLYHLDLYDDVKMTLKNDVGNIIKSLTEWFGPKGSHLSIVLSNRKGGGGYGRIGGIFMGGFNSDKYIENNKAYQRYFGHELAHMWWHTAPVQSWEDWLNEGFAEFSGLMIVRKNYGEEAFQEFISKKEKDIANTTPIWGFNRTSKDPDESENAQKVLYSKGPLLLYQLEQKIGNEDFIRLSQATLNYEKLSTNILLKELARIKDSNTADWFENLLKTY